MSTRTFTRIFAGAIALAVCVGAGVVSLRAQDKKESEGFQPLFDGKSLTGWKVLGGKAKYRIEDGAIVGTSVPNTPNSFLSTEKSYGEFVLEYEFLVDPRLNSGVQIRSGSRKSYRNGRVHGYQVEIDPDVKRDRMWTAGIYDEGRRGWLNDLSENEPARKAFRPEQWNRVRVEAIGDSIRTWLNGVPAADLVDSFTLSGFIALQVHGVGKRTDPLEVRWRNLRLKDLGIRRWKPLWDGKTLEGWHQLPGGRWEVRDGRLVGTSSASERRHGMLITDRRFKDFTVRLKYKAVKGNSGFYFRVDKVDGAVGVHGFQAEIDPRRDVGGLYETGGRAWVVKPTERQVARWLEKKNWLDVEEGWNLLSVSARGRRIVVHLNGHRTAELRNDPGRTEGHIGLQLHGGQDMHVEFKDIEILGEAVPRSAAGS
ncbi:MAG: DUF1080 domain-containing protein [Planctomycetota bacterium]|nr:DUF1080 domain-containing protein [Planctomycetota bacterium]